MQPSLRDWLSQGPFTLALSSSFFGFFAHCGFAAALYEQGFKPQKITGSSAGALVGGALASDISPHELYEILKSMRQSDFWDPKPGLGYLRGQKFQQLLKKHFKATFDEATIPLEVAVFDILACKSKFLSRGDIPSAVAASCAVPLMFHPVKIDGRFFYDGGMFLKSAIKTNRHIDKKTDHPLHHDTDHSQERVLCVFLESDGLSGIYESKTTFKKLDRDHKVLRIKNLPQVSFNKMHVGPEAYTQVYSRSLAAFDKKFNHSILEA